MKLHTFVSLGLLLCLAPSLALGQIDTLTSQAADACGFDQIKHEVATTPVCADGPPMCYPQWLALAQRLQTAVDCRMKALMPKGKGVATSISNTISSPQ